MTNGPGDRAERISEAARTGGSVRLHLEDGEVVVARILDPGPDEVVYVPEHSSRPEKYAVCDATGFSVPSDAILEVSPVRARKGGSGRRAR
jgi:hypothetical protein